MDVKAGPQEIKISPGVRRVIVSTDCQLLVAKIGDYELEIWDILNQEVRYRLPQKIDAELYHIIATQENGYVGIGIQQNRLKAWRLEDLEEVEDFPAFNEPANGHYPQQ